MKGASRLAVMAAVFASMSIASVSPVEAARPPVQMAIPKSLFNPVATRSWPVDVRLWVARALKEECQVFAFLCPVVAPPPVPSSTTVPPPVTLVVPSPTTVTTTTVPTTVSTTVPVTVVTLPVVTVPISTPTTSCTVTVEGGGVAQCYSNISVNQG
jgi:hypothetical protein